MLAFDGSHLLRMDLETLIREANDLSLPTTYLVPEPIGQPIGIWWGPDSGPHDGDSFCWLATTGAPGFESEVLSVYIDDLSGAGSARVVEGLPRATDLAGHPLYPRVQSSLPPLEAIFLFGSDKIASWLDSLGWPRDCPHNGNFPDSVADEYERVYQAQHPLYTDEAWAALGGWHFPWPDGDWNERLADRLLLTTFRDSEPWIEVWSTDMAGLRVFGRIT